MTKIQKRGNIIGIKIGFKTSGNSVNPLLESYLQVHDCRTLFTMHQVEPNTKPESCSQSFRHDNVFPINTSNLYANHATAICNQLLYNVPECKQNLPNEISFQRGHLAACGDFRTKHGQYATYTFANSAPQFYKMNMGNWKSIETQVRNLATSLNRSLDVKTGTLGILNIKNRENQDSEIFLSPNLIPVPAMFYKIIIDTNNAQAVVFINMNRHLNQQINCMDTFNIEDNLANLQWYTTRENKINICAYTVREFLMYRPASGLNYLRQFETLDLLD